ncbi:hypothetical protein DN052_03155 [Acidithiobacillus ferrooxidans]|uniref:Methyl-accepting chemotaxis protein n=2 Tax=Acidithiobacillus ferrooxidans TaxID=920 RepID=A0A2W1KI09_ACIFR|nr:hypothetical protein DN052_03155 [Acidithiobacillus ferrooxidans]
MVVIMESGAKTVEPKDHVSGDNLEKLSHWMTRLTEEVQLALAETTKAVVSLTAVVELIRSQAANVEKMAEEVSELAGMAQKRTEHLACSPRFEYDLHRSCCDLAGPG